MKTPTIEEVKEYFKDAETVKCNYGVYKDLEYYPTFKDVYFDASTKAIYTTTKDNSTDCCLWSKRKGYAKILTYKKPTYTITKETVIKYNMKDEFPEVFKKELVVGRWYWYGKTLFNYQLDYDVYGFEQDGSWCNIKSWKWSSSRGYDRKATPQEVESALICEAKKIGYDRGVLIYSEWAGGCTLDDKKPYLKNNELWFGDCRIFVDGKWADIAEKMTLSQIEKELGRKIELI